MIRRESLQRTAAGHSVRQGQLRIGAHALALLAGIVTMALVASVFFVLNSVLPAQATAQPTPDQHSRAIAAVQQRFTGEVEDPLVQVAQDVFVRQSNLQGIEVDGVRYYYAILGHQSFDPVSLGQAQREQAEIIYRSESAGFPMIIYYLPGH